MVTGENGICEGINGKGYIDMSTLSEVAAVEISYEIISAGGLCLEAPVSGSKGPAEQGQLIFLTSGMHSTRNPVHQDLSSVSCTVC